MTRKIMVTGCGGYAAIGFTRCLRATSPFSMLGTDSDTRYVHFSETGRTCLIPSADADNYIAVINDIVDKYKIVFVHAQPPAEIPFLSKARAKIHAKLSLPRHETIVTCNDKLKSNAIWKAEGIATAESVICQKETLTATFVALDSPVWLRAITGAGAKGAFLAKTQLEAEMWLNINNGWGNFMASEYLPGDNFGCDLLFDEGELICSQTKQRLEYVLHKANITGITGTTGILKCVKDKLVNIKAEEAIYAIDKAPHGVFAVDFKADGNRDLCVTEINAGRFLSSSLHLFHKAPLSLPFWYVKLALGEQIPKHEIYNPIADGLMLLRQVDTEPKVIMHYELESLKRQQEADGYAEIM